MMNTVRYFSAILSLTLFVTSLVNGDMECELLLEVNIAIFNRKKNQIQIIAIWVTFVTLLQNGDSNYLAHSKLGNVFAGFNQIFDTVHRSESIQKSLDSKTMNFVEL